jgi:hypothetical protein
LIDHGDIEKIEVGDDGLVCLGWGLLHADRRGVSARR